MAQEKNQISIEEMITKSAEIIKTYVDKKDEILSTDLKKQVVDTLAKEKDFNERIEGLKKVANAFIDAYDVDKNGVITKDEILKKTQEVLTNSKDLQVVVDKLKDELSQIQSDLDDTFDHFAEQMVSKKELVSIIETSQVNTLKALKEMFKI